MLKGDFTVGMWLFPRELKRDNVIASSGKNTIMYGIRIIYPENA